MSCKIEKLSDAPGAYLNGLIGGITNVFYDNSRDQEAEQYYECAQRFLEICEFVFFLGIVYILKRIFIDGESAKKILFWQKRRR